ncbi:RNA-directed DNA polymerase from mobile element jockey [Elysia marginata]|uniref:RNA-directed DNA polymerase from mobile element jockey n=1 Tax=Elysia marginata TaxID=1093978 RepID=A0AAV4G8B0_9GAST|nr:RNA-directed DNA polymerase from mobile element jockey [Elysia marginata]
MNAALLQLYNISWTTGNIPQIWKEAIMIRICKQGKDQKKPEIYRPVSFMRCLGKTMKRMLYKSEMNNILKEKEAGFRRGRCTEDQIILIAQGIEDGFQRKKPTVVVWIDMEKAFNRVWRDGLLLKLKDSGNMFKWIEHCLKKEGKGKNSEF